MNKLPTGILVFDIDGVINDKHTTEIKESILQKIDELCKKGYKVYFNTGRSMSYCVEMLFPKLQNYPNILAHKPFAMCEKGVVKVRYENGEIQHQVLEQYSVVKYADELLKDLDVEFETFFRDTSKVSMITFEKKLGVDLDKFDIEIDHFTKLIQRNLNSFNLQNILTIEKTVIALDIQHKFSGKDLGAVEIVKEVESYLAKSDRENVSVFTFGDSPSDAAMAVHFASQNFVTTHVDVGAKAGDRESSDYKTIIFKNTFENGTEEFLELLILG